LFACSDTGEVYLDVVRTGQGSSRCVVRLTGDWKSLSCDWRWWTSHSVSRIASHVLFTRAGNDHSLSDM